MQEEEFGFMKMAYADGGERREIGIQTRQKLRPNVLATSGSSPAFSRHTGFM